MSEGPVAAASQPISQTSHLRVLEIPFFFFWLGPEVFLLFNTVLSKWRHVLYTECGLGFSFRFPLLNGRGRRVLGMGQGSL